MTRLVTLLAMLFACATPAIADVTITQTMAMEGPMAKMMGGGAPQMVMRIKGLQSRAEVQVMDQTIATITDLAEGRVIVLDAANRTARVIMPRAGATGMPMTLPKFDMSVAPTGRTQIIEGASCEEHTFKMSINMAEAGAAGQAPPEAVAAMKDVRMAMSGSLWVAKSGPGVDEYVRFQKAAADSKVLAAMTGMKPGAQPGGLDQLMAASAAVPGLPYLTEITMSFEGTGKLVEMMKGMGPIKMTQRTTAVSTETLPDDLFRVPADYKLVDVPADHKPVEP